MNTPIQIITTELTHVFLLSVGAFLLAMLMTPMYTLFAYRYRFWKTQRTSAVTGEQLQVFNKLHEDKLRHNIL